MNFLPVPSVKVVLGSNIINGDSEYTSPALIGKLFMGAYSKPNLNEFLFVPNTHAHGFLTLEDNTIVTYLVKGRYDLESEHSIVWNEIEDVKRLVETYIGDKQLIISEKDVLGK